jgi:cytochrome c556
MILTIQNTANYFLNITTPNMFENAAGPMAWVNQQMFQASIQKYSRKVHKGIWHHGNTP